MKQKFKSVKEKMNKLFQKFAPVKEKAEVFLSKLPKRKPHSEKYYKRIAFFNRYSLIFHFILACFITFTVEVISRRDFFSAVSFVGNHTWAYLYNAFIVFASLSIVYLFKTRAQLRVLITGLWIFLGTVNGIILSNRVTPFSYTDFKMLPDLFAMQNTNYFTAEEATVVVAVVASFIIFLVLFFIKGPKYQGKRHIVLSPLAIVALLVVGIPITTQAAQSSNIIASYFANIAQGYSDYGFVYGFSTSVVDALVIGYYDIASKKQSDVICENGFYISSGLPAVIDNSVILPVTLNTNEHKLMKINADSNTSEMIFNEFNSYPIDSVATMNTGIYMLSSKKDNSTATSYIRKYNENTNEMDICIEKEFTDNTGEQIKAFACNNEKIYVMVNQIETENDTYIEIYDDKNYDLIGKLYFDSELKNFVSNNGIVQFYCFDNYVYIRNFSDYGAIGKIESNQVKTLLDLPNLRIAYNGKNTQDNYYGFFLRSGKDFYLLDVYTDTLYQTNLELSQDESIRNAISDGNDICISIMNERDTETFTTKNTIMVDFDKLKKSISVLTS